MHISDEEDEYKLSLSKFESMLKTNKVLFFDSEEFEEIEYEGNQNLCWSTSISEIERFGLI